MAKRELTKEEEISNLEATIQHATLAIAELEGAEDFSNIGNAPIDTANLRAKIANIILQMRQIIKQKNLET